MTDDELERWKQKIAVMSHVEMVSLWRFSPAGHPCFDSSLPLYDIFKKRLDSFGGITPAVSKEVG